MWPADAQRRATGRSKKVVKEAALFARAIRTEQNRRNVDHHRFACPARASGSGRSRCPATADLARAPLRALAVAGIECDLDLRRSRFDHRRVRRRTKGGKPGKQRKAGKKAA